MSSESLAGISIELVEINSPSVLYYSIFKTGFFAVTVALSATPVISLALYPVVSVISFVAAEIIVIFVAVPLRFFNSNVLLERSLVSMVGFKVIPCEANC